MGALSYSTPGGLFTVRASEQTGIWSRVKSIANAMTNPRVPGGNAIIAMWAGIAIAVGGGVYWYYNRTKSTSRGRRR